MKSRLSLILFMIFLVPLAVAWTPPSNINLWDYYNITNGSYVSADAFLQNGNLVIDNTSIANTSVNYSSYANSSTYWDDETSQADLNVNSSTYWDSETSQADLNVNSSTWWASVSSFVARWFYDDSNVLSFNETRLNATIDDRDTDTVWTRNDTWIVNESGSLSWNETSGDSRYYTQTAADAAFIAVGDEGNLNVNSSTWWASVSSFASRWFDDVANVLTFNETLLNSTIDTIDLATNASMKTYVDTQDSTYNSSMKTYVDAQDVIYNDSLKDYGDSTYINQSEEGNLNVNSSDYWDSYGDASDLTNAVLSHAANVTYDGTETVEEILDDTLNYCVLDEITVTDDGTIQISWGTGEIFNHGNTSVVDTSAGVANLTNNLPNYLLWNSGTSLSVSTTKPNTSQIEVAHISVQSNDIWDIHTEHICSEREQGISDGMANILPVIVTSGLIVSENTDGTYAFDVILSAGVYYHDGHEKHTLSTIFTNVSNMTRWYHNSSGDWVSDSSPQMNSTHYDNGSELVAVSPATKFTRSVFFVDDSRLHWVYGNTQYVSVGTATSASNPIIPPGFIDIDPESTALIIQANAAALPTAGGDQWIDARPVIGAASSGGAITDHGNLAGLSDDDHTQYLLASGSRGLSANWAAGAWNITASYFIGLYNWAVGSTSDEYLSFNGSQLDFNETKLNATINTIGLATNASMKTYVDAQDVIYNDSMVTYVDAQDVVYNDSLVTYIDAQDVVYNDSMVTYVDLQDVYYNESLKNYSDDTFQIEIGAGCSGGTPVMTAVNNDGSVNCTAAGAGDITDVNTDVSSGYLAGGQDTGQVNLSINETKFDDDFWNRSAGVSAFVNRSLWTSIDNYANDCVSPDIMRGVNDTLNCITPDSTAQCTGDVCGGGHTHPASEVTAGTFGAGDYVMGSDLTVERLFFENGTSDMFITAPNSTTMEWRGITASIFLH